MANGVYGNERILGSIGVEPKVEGIQEIIVRTNACAAQAAAIEREVEVSVPA